VSGTRLDLVTGAFSYSGAAIAQRLLADLIVLRNSSLTS